MSYDKNLIQSEFTIDIRLIGVSNPIDMVIRMLLDWSCGLLSILIWLCLIFHVRFQLYWFCNIKRKDLFCKGKTMHEEGEWKLEWVFGGFLGSNLPELQPAAHCCWLLLSQEILSICELQHFLTFLLSPLNSFLAHN